MCIGTSIFPVPGTCYDAKGNQVPDGYYEDPANCRKFYACGGGISYHMDCGAGTIYNPESRSCDINDDGRICTSRDVPIDAVGK